MASSSSSYSNPNNNNNSHASVPIRYDPNLTPNTTFVQADPSTFRAVVQKLTGSTTTHDPPTQKVPLTPPSRQMGKPISGDMGPRRPAFKLHERRQSGNKLEIKLNNNNNVLIGGSVGSSGGQNTPGRLRSFVGFGGEMMMVSPVSPFDLFSRGSPRTPRSPYDLEEERAIAEKVFYLHPSPLTTPRGSDPPELLPLFPLTSPRDDDSSPSS